MSSVQIRSVAPAFHSKLILHAPRAGFDRRKAKVPKGFGAMKFAIVVGRAIGLAAAEGWAVEVPNAARAIEVGGPTTHPRPGPHDHDGTPRFTGLSISPVVEGISAPVPGDRVQPPSPALGRGVWLLIFGPQSIRLDDGYGNLLRRSLDWSRG
jgi:hypothetical protein